jgi:hypothetical protein
MSNVTYKVQLSRVINDAKLGPTVMYLTVQAPNANAAKNLAESMARGYKALRADPQR